MKKSNILDVSTSVPSEIKRELFRPNLFKKMQGNRNIDKNHVKRLEKSMSEKYLPTLICVNKNNEIVDGQHRIEAMQSLYESGKTPMVYYIVSEDCRIDDATRYNSTHKGWTLRDHIDSYIKQGYTDYETLKSYTEKYSLGPGYIASCLMLNKYVDGKVASLGGNSISETIKNGNFKINHPKTGLELIELGNDLSQELGYKQTSLRIMFRDSKVEFPKLANRLLQNARRIDKPINHGSTTYERAGQIQKLYNFYTRKKDVEEVFDLDKYVKL